MQIWGEICVENVGDYVVQNKYESGNVRQICGNLVEMCVEMNEPGKCRRRCMGKCRRKKGEKMRQNKIRWESIVIKYEGK